MATAVYGFARHRQRPARTPGSRATSNSKKSILGMGTSTPSACIRLRPIILWKVATTQKFYQEYAQQPYVVTESVMGNWYDAHALWAASNPPTTSEEYKLSVATWLQTDEGKGYQEDVLLDAQNNILATKTDVRWKFNKKELDTPMILNRMLRSRSFGRKHASAVKPRFYQFAFVFAEGIRVVLRESVISLCIACVAVLVVLLLLLGDLWAACLVASSVIMVCLITYGSIYWYNDHLNNVSAFFVIIAVGLATDASAHYCVAFLESSQSSRKDRAVGHRGPRFVGAARVPGGYVHHPRHLPDGLLRHLCLPDVLPLFDDHTHTRRSGSDWWSCPWSAR